MSSWSTIRRILTLSCDESTRLVSESLDRDLPVGERLAVRLHAVGCLSCRRFARQLRFLRAALRHRDAETAADGAPVTLSPEARERIHQLLTERESS